MSTSMSAADDDGAGDDATMMCSPPSRRPSNNASSSSKPTNKRSRRSNDWVEDEVHPSFVAKRAVSSPSALAALSAQLLDGGSLFEETTTTTAANSGSTTTLCCSSPPLLSLRRAFSSTAPGLNSSVEFDAHAAESSAPTGAPSSPSDPSPLLDLRKAALLRSRFLSESREKFGR